MRLSYEYHCDTAWDEQAIQEFDQSLYEDESVNRMQEAVMLFDSVSNSRYFSETSIILFLNKIDLFKQKLKQGVLLKDYCADYTGDNDFESGYDGTTLHWSTF